MAARAELIELVRRIIRDDSPTEEESDALVLEFSRSVPHPEATNLIFYPRRYFGHHEPTAEEIVDRALSYRAIELGPGDAP